MKTLTFIVSLLFAIAALQAQDYQISFTGSGQSTDLDSIQVENLIQGTVLSLDGNDILHLVETTGVNSLINNKNIIKVFPNPMIESTIIEFLNLNTETVCIEIFNEMGVLITKQHTLIQKGIQRFELLGMNAGIYTINVSSTDWKYAAKLISLGNNPENIRIKHLSTNDESAPKNALKSIKDLVQMQYNDGEMILFKAFAGNYATVLTLIPTQSQTVNFELIPCSDEDGNNYAVVAIGSQTWMAENLKTTKYSDGTDIPLVTDGNTWGGLITPAYCWYFNDIAYKLTYGALYNWYTVETGNLCPTGWHVPSDVELETLIDYAGGSDVAGGKLKSIRTEPSPHPRWNSPNTGAINEYGFSALPGSFRNSGSGGFSGLGNWGRWWSSTEDVPGFAFSLHTVYYDESAYKRWALKIYGYSVRCLKDN